MPALQGKTMNLSSIFALFIAMVVLAAIPSLSVLTVSTRAATAGFIHGVFTAIGIVVGDIIFILLALGGLSVLATKLGGLFIIIKYLGGGYLIWLGINLCRIVSTDVETDRIADASLFASFLAGLSLTLADQKAVLFYLAFFPAFIDLSQVSYLDTAIVIGVTFLAVGGVKLFYAFMADRARLMFDPRINKRMNILAGVVTIAVGIFLLFKPQ